MPRYLYISLMIALSFLQRETMMTPARIFGKTLRNRARWSRKTAAIILPDCLFQRVHDPRASRGDGQSVLFALAG